MFLLIFMVSGDCRENTRLFGTTAEASAYLDMLYKTPGKCVKWWEILCDNDEICQHLGLAVEMCEDRHEKVVWS